MKDRLIMVSLHAVSLAVSPKNNMISNQIPGGEKGGGTLHAFSWFLGIRRWLRRMFGNILGFDVEISSLAFHNSPV